MSKFDWQTEEDWEELTLPPEAPKETRPRRWRWLVGLLMVLGLAAYFIYNQVEQRVEVATNTVEQDILSSLELLERANQEQDIELVNGILSGRDPAWTDIQRDLVRNSLLFDRTPFGFTLVGGPEVMTTELAPDLLSAELSLHSNYAIAIGNGLTETITLEQLAVFRKGARTWLYAPPDEEFWGDMESVSGSFITVRYPTRDEDISRRLANDLERKIGELCANMAFNEINCQGGARVDLTFANHSAGLVMANDAELWLQAGRELILPAPTLIGLPINEAGYQALYRGYAMVVLQAFVGERTGWQCCERGLLVQALLDRQFATLALKPWPLLPTDYTALLNQGILLDDVTNSLDAPMQTIPSADDWQHLYALADFLASKTQATAPVTLIPQVSGRDTLGWLSGLLGAELNSNDSHRQWQAFLYEQSGLAALPPPIPWPDEAAVMLCGPNFPDAAALYTYQPANQTWTEELPGRGFFTLQPLPNRDGAVLIEQYLGLNNQPPQTILWQDDQVTPIYDGYFVLRTTNQAGNLLAGSSLAFNNSTDGTAALFSSFSTDVNAVIDQSACTNGTCPYQSLSFPNLTWSPDDQHTLAYVTRANSAGEFRINDSLGQPNEIGPVGTGSNGFWLDNDHLIYLRSLEVIKTNIHTKEAETLLVARDLHTALPDPDAINRLTINQLALSQSEPDQLFILATTSSDLRAAYLFQVNLTTGLITFLTRLGDVPLPAVEIGKNFRIPAEITANAFQVSVTIVHELNNPVYYFYTYQIAQDKTTLVKLVGGTNLGNYAWSDDGYWLISTDAGIVKLIAPGWGYQQWVPHDFANCRAADWLNE